MKNIDWITQNLNEEELRNIEGGRIEGNTPLITAPIPVQKPIPVPTPMPKPVLM